MCLRLPKIMLDGVTLQGNDIVWNCSKIYTSCSTPSMWLWLWSSCSRCLLEPAGLQTRNMRLGRGWKAYDIIRGRGGNNSSIVPTVCVWPRISPGAVTQIGDQEENSKMEWIFQSKLISLPLDPNLYIDVRLADSRSYSNLPRRLGKKIWT